jgi:hypothetical protein
MGVPFSMCGFPLISSGGKLNMKTLLFRFGLVSSCLLLCSALVFPDTIKLKNGSIIKGKVTTYNDREFTIYLDLGSSNKRSTSRMVIAVEDVESITFDTSEPALATTPAPAESGERLIARDLSAKEPPLNSPPAYTNTPAKSSTAGETALFDKSVLVAAAADWTSTEIRVKKGQRISISATGQVDLGSNRVASPNGIQLSDPKRLILTSPTGALIAVIGDDNDEFIHIGSQAEFVAERDGILFLSVNEGNLKDNNGSFSAKVKVMGK